MTKPAIKYVGGKNRLAPTIHRLAPQTIINDPTNGYIHRTYPYGGGLGEIWTWEYEGISEIANDINLDITNFWRVLQSESAFKLFKRTIEATPFSRIEFDTSKTTKRPIAPDIIPSVEAAVSFFTLCRQSRSGGMKSFAPITKRRTRRGMNEQTSAWWTAIEGLDEARQRIKRIAIEMMDACAFIKQEDTTRTLHYCDPPYYTESKSTPNTYTYEMTHDQHAELLQTLKQIKAKSCCPATEIHSTMTN